MNGKPHKELIYGTPKLAYPYKDFENFEFNLPQCNQVYVGNKWNGMNLLIYKYHDSNGESFLTAKSKGIPFLKNSNYGNFLDLACKALGLDTKTRNYKEIEILKELNNPSVLNIAFELCGQLEPHLVNYDFDLEAKPLFITYTGGKIKPILTQGELNYGPISLTTEEIVKLCKEFQITDEEANEQYRKAKGLSLKYEYNYFIREGRVLYCLDKDGYVINKTLYKIKPHDIEEVHWSRFDETLEGRVDEVLKKIKERELPLTELVIQDELDMGKKEWGRFSQSILQYVSSKGLVVRK